MPVTEIQQRYHQEQADKTERARLKVELQAVLESNPEMAWDICDLMIEVGESVGSILGRQVVWHLVDRDQAEFTIDRKFKHQVSSTS